MSSKNKMSVEELLALIKATEVTQEMRDALVERLAESDKLLEEEKLPPGFMDIQYTI